MVALVSVLIFLILLAVFVGSYHEREGVARGLALTESLNLHSNRLRAALVDYLLDPAADRHSPVVAEFAAIDSLLQGEAQTIAELLRHDAQGAQVWDDLHRSMGNLRGRLAALDSSRTEAHLTTTHQILADCNSLARFVDAILHRAVARFLALTALENLSRALLIASMAGLGIGFYLAFRRAILKPLSEVHTAATQIAAGDMGVRLNSRRLDEWGELADAFDRMLDQVQATTVSRERLETEIAEHTQTELALRASEERLQLAMEVGRSFAFEWDPISDRVRRSANTAGILGLSPTEGEQTSRHDHVEQIIPADQARFVAVLESLKPDQDRYRMDYHFVRGDGAMVILEESGRGFFDAAGRLQRVIGVATDITERRLAAAAARTAQARYQCLLDANMIGVAIAEPGGAILEANQYYLDLVGQTFEDLAAGTVSWRNVTPPEWLPADVQAIAELQARGTCTPYEKEYLRADGSRAPVLLVDALLPGDHDKILCLALDIAERKRMEQELHNLAVTDPLTGAMNRRHLMQVLDSEIQCAHRYGRALALVMFDLDHFKAINDTYGHDQGDAVLIAVVAQAQQRLRRSDTLARWGGEEFMILLPEAGLTEALTLAESIREHLHVVPGGGSGRVTASFGVSAYRPEETLDRWLKRVDAMLYKAKHEGRNRIAA